MELLTENIQPLTEGQKIGEAIYAISGKDNSVTSHPDGSIEINWLGQPEIPDHIIRQKIRELDELREKLPPRKDPLTSAKEKLDKLGLTEEEIQALINSK
tara:strand:+ start:667 stop:966 length:300 start_codon:yes stop_codon:yes gene_type:complete